MILEEGLILNPAVKIATESRREKRAAFQVYYPHPEGYDFQRPFELEDALDHTGTPHGLMAFSGDGRPRQRPLLCPALTGP